MIQYKLIQEYPGSPKLGTIDWYKTDEFGPSSNSIWQGTNFYDAHPKYWQKVEEVDYEIISLKLTGGEIITFKNGKCIHRTDDQSVDYTFNLDKCMSNLSSTEYIHSVKRLSDGEVFTIGDLIDFGDFGNKGFRPIGKIEVDYFDKTRVTAWDGAYGKGAINKWEKASKKTPLFTTEDGVEIFEGDKFYYPNIHIWKTIISEADKRVLIFIRLNKYKPFSTKEKSEEYILLNKPCLSVNEIIAVIPGFNFHKEILIAKAKSKL